MKLNDPRSTLVAGLALALGLNVSLTAFGAGGVSSKPMRLAQSQSNAPTPGTPSLSPVPAVPNLSPQPTSPTAPSVITAPANLGSQPSLVPIERPPLGLLYGEQELLDGKKTTGIRPLAPPMGVYPSTPTTPPVTYGLPQDPVPMMNGVPNNQSTSILTPVPMETIPLNGAVDRFGYAPPPGTLGQTYKRRSRLLEETKHPRVGVVEVRLPENVDVSARGLKTKWDGKVWRLESDPLLPGVPHIYEVKASYGPGTEPQYRTVRLIMGRIVELEF